MKRRILAAVAIALLVCSSVFTPVLAVDYPVDGYVFPSTNEANRLNGGPYVYQADVGIGWIEIAFVDPQAHFEGEEWHTVAKFEYRIDGEIRTPGSCTPHEVIGNECRYRGRQVTDPVVPGGDTEIGTFNAEWPGIHEKIEIRKAGGSERDTDFDWVAFYVLPDAQSKDDCKNGGYAGFGFDNQGQCIQFVNTGKDSR